MRNDVTRTRTKLSTSDFQPLPVLNAALQIPGVIRKNPCNHCYEPA